MKLAVTSTGSDMDSTSDGKFGRCSYFVIVDTESKEHDSIENASKTARGGAGVQAAETLANAGADAVATGNVGPNAFEALDAAGVEIYTGASGTVEEVVEAFENGNLTRANEPTTAGGRGK